MNLTDKITRKILTRPIHWLETTRRYPIREKAFELSPITVNSSPSKILTVLTTPATIFDAVWAAQSLLRNLPSDLGLVIVIDGEISIDAEQKLKNIFPNLTIQLTSHIIDSLQSISPKLANFGKLNPIGRKLAMLLWNQFNHNILYSDSDVLCFGEIPEVCEAISNSSRPIYIQDIGVTHAEPRLLRSLQKLNHGIENNLNSGFLYIPQGSFNVEFIEYLLSQDVDFTSWFVEQTIVAVLMKQLGAEPLPKSSYVVSTQRQFCFEDDVDYNEVKIRHFITPVRHLMYSKGMPRLYQQWQ
jgi:hypothetical protein